MLQPKKTKYRKMMKGRMKGTETRGTKLEFGGYALQAVEPGWITSRQIEAARRAMTREIKRGGNVWIKIFPDKPITAKPAETRMGKYSRINRLLQNLLKLVWAQVKVIWNTG